MKVSGGKRVRLEIGAHERRHEGEIDNHEFAVHVPPDLRWFLGHFEGNPVLPAIVQIQEVLRLVTATWPDLAGLRRITRAKFQKPIRPSDALRVRLMRVRGAKKATYEYRRGGETCSSGTLEFARARGARR
jgi:3-hydroxymyristoyl/3-hydroxydecanoyl-(acyl carrier protein) dehydratase